MEHKELCWAMSSKGLFKWKTTFPVAGTDRKPTHTWEISPESSQKKTKAHTYIFSFTCSHHLTLNQHLWSGSSSSFRRVFSDHVIKALFLLAYIRVYSLWFQTFSIALTGRKVSRKKKITRQAKTGGFRSSGLWDSMGQRLDLQEKYSYLEKIRHIFWDC